MKAVILIIYGLYNGQPVAIQQGVYPNGEDCRAKAALIIAGAELNGHNDTRALCLLTPFTYAKPARVKL
ncbi:hypothetical protein [Mesorhizobium sp. WSM4982]|uniref:hypothetical protein n=1 Tax=Mesorhizobium sp. WSM4982 TaxID=3038550 RepID=UPI0024159180|nr:hypothetical protein [Mesorhizobium sp. WSM4982]MDG4856414.1 hypothetical protein [Mesorhizobium sp. WSM4982]